MCVLSLKLTLGCVVLFYMIKGNGMLTDEEQLAQEIDVHMIALLRSDSKQATAIAWMKRAYLLLERSSKNLRAPRIYSVPGTYGVRTYMLTPPKSLIIPVPAYTPTTAVWFGGKTVEYGDKYQNRTRPWTPKDGRRLVRQREREKALKAAK